jgi:hypothetical protein
MASSEPWAVVTIVGACGAELARTTLAGDRVPDMAAVDDLARLALLARRLRGRAVVSVALPLLLELIELAGLPVKVERQPELREEALGVEEREEERHVGDLPA